MAFIESRYWYGVMDEYKTRRAESKDKGLTIAEEMYGRAERIARAEIEMAEAFEAVERKASR